LITDNDEIITAIIKAETEKSPKNEKVIVNPFEPKQNLIANIFVQNQITPSNMLILPHTQTSTSPRGGNPNITMSLNSGDDTALHDQNSNEGTYEMLQ